ncbi:MAG: OmpL47-type beta-barrel domain-containing protein [Acidimicrobiia bacterium]
MSKRSWNRVGRALLAAVTVVGMLGAGVIEAATTAAPAAAAGTSPDGLTSQTAGASCWSIKQGNPGSTDGIYWIRTPKLVDPQQFYCDMTTDGGGWVLVGRGREGWTFPYWGEGSPSTVRTTITGPAAFSPAALPTPTVDGLLNGGRMDSLTDGIRLRRATDSAGNGWQESRMYVANFGTWSWAFGGGIPLSGVQFDGTTTTFSPGSYQTNTTGNVQVANDMRRITTAPIASHNNIAGFSYGGSSTVGQNNATSYLWQYASEGNAIPFTQVFIRPKVTEADIVAAGISHAPDAGLPATAVRKMLDRIPVDQSWAVTGINMGSAISNMSDYVKSFAQIGNTLYMGGKFLQVVNGIGGPKYTQSYLAAFDVNTGEWIPSFNPVIDAPVWKLMASPDGTKLFVGGEFTNVNGVPNTTALAALDPTTGAPVPATSWLAYASRPTGSYDVRAMSIQGQWLYLGGNFTRIAGGTGTNFVGPLTDARLARVRLSDGRPDWNWMPTLDTAPMDVNASPQGDRVYAVGTFTTLNGTALPSIHEATMDTMTGALVPGLKPWVPTQPTVTEPSNTIMEVGDHVYQGGSQHYLHSYARSDYSLERSHLTQATGGDFQAMALKDGILYAACHCVTDWQYQDTTAWPNPAGYSRVDPINLIGAFDTTNNLETMPEFHPTRIRLKGSGGEGPWSLFFDSNGCMWAGGDLLRQGAVATDYYGGYEKFCDRDSQPPATPPNARADVAGNTVTLSWSASSDNSTDPIQYEILRDDPALGTVVEGTTYNRTWTDTNVVGPTRYFLRALDATGNRSATTAVIAVTPPPAALATLVAHGDSWSYRDDGQNLGAAWRQPGFDVSSWPTGSSQLGWGGKGESTTIAGTGTTSYFVRHVDVSDPSSYKTLTVRLKRDDGAAVYVNGTEVVRDNLPAGALTANTVAAGYTSGAAESTWYEFTVPATLLTAGTNTVAVELHQADAANGDGVFDLELVARGAAEANAPTAPVVSVAGTSATTATLSWTPSTDDSAVAGYLVRRNGAVVAFTASTTFADTGLTPSTGYSYDVRAMDNSGNVSPAGTAVTTTLANPALVKSGDVWSYRSDGTDPGTAWRQPGFDASSWASGPSQLGWGNRGEVTVVPSGQITQYFVHHFAVGDPSDEQQLQLRLKRDDAAAVYLNGVEIARSNLPAGALTSTTYASTAVTAADGVSWKQFDVPGALLNAGDNVIAVELHQDSRSDTRAVFDLELAREAAAEQNPPTRPAVNLVSRGDTSISFQWTSSTDDAAIAGYLVRRNGTLVGYTSGTTFADTGLTPNSPYGYQVVAVDTSGNLSTTGSLAVSTTASTAITQSGDVWSYKTDGTDPGTAWRQPGFDASSWASGPSQLGWGNRGEATVIPSGQITQYFLRHVNVANPATLQQVNLRVKRDDGIAVYVNGTEVARDNLPAGALTASTYPTTKVTAADGVTWKQFTVPASAFVAGDNVIAAEVHQDARSDTRAVFDLELTSTATNNGPVVTVTSPANSGYLTTAPATITGLCTTSAGTVTVSVTGAQSSTLSSPCVTNEWSVTAPLADGSYAVSAAQTDSSGATGTSPTVSFTVDTAAPTVTLETPAPGATFTTATLTFAGHCTTGEGSVTVAATGGAAMSLLAPCTAGAYSVAGPALPTGAYVATAAQTDAAGNRGASAGVPFTVDVAAPVTTDDTATIGSAWRNGPVTVTLTPTDVGVGVAQTYFTTDGSTPTTSSSTGTVIPLATSGSYTIKYFSVDGLGNTEAVKTAANPVRIDLSGPSTTDNTATIGNAWKTTAQTVTLTASDTGGSGLAATYFTTDGTTPTIASPKGTTISLTASGTYTIRYLSVDNAGNIEPVRTAGTQIRIDRTAPTTADNTASIGNAWKTTAQTVTLTPADAGGSGLAATYFTTDGSTPTAASAQGTTIILSNPGTYTIRYFSVDGAGNAEAVRTAGTQIRVDGVAPTATMTFPVNGASYNASRWSAGCSSSNRICGTASDATSGISSPRVTIQRLSDSRYWTGSTWSTTTSTLTASGTTSWYVPLATSALANGTSYTVTAVTTDGAGNTTTRTATFTYDTTAPSATSATVANHSGSVQAGTDTLSVTFGEALDPTKVPATGTLTLSRSRTGNTTWGISGLTNGQLSTGTTGYLKQPTFGSYTVIYAGSLALSNGNRTVTFTVTGACSGSCSNLSTTAVSGAWVFTPATSLLDLAGNAATGTLTAAASSMF